MDAISASYCGCNSCEVRNPVFDCILANVGVVNLRLLSDWGVDDKLDVSVLEFIEDVWTPLVDFEDGLCGDSRCLKALESAFGCKELQSVGYELPCGGQDCLVIPWGDRDEDSPPGWQRRLRSLLGLEECQPQVL